MLHAVLICISSRLEDQDYLSLEGREGVGGFNSTHPSPVGPFRLPAKACGMESQYSIYVSFMRALYVMSVVWKIPDQKSRAVSVSRNGNYIYLRCLDEKGRTTKDPYVISDGRRFEMGGLQFS